MENAELVVPRVAHYPEVVAPLLLVVPPGSTESFQASYLCFYVVGLEVKVHPFFATFGVGSGLEQYADFAVRQAKLAVDLGTGWVYRFLDSIENGGPEGSTFVEVIDIDYKMG